MKDGKTSEFETEISLRNKWMARARKMTVAELPAFIQELIDFEHDYGTICRAIAAAAVGAAYAVESSPKGGITGFQSGCVMWDMITGWDATLEGRPLKLIDYNNMLYPQYADNFSQTISKDTWTYLQKKAKENLITEGHAHQNVIAHWRKIASGIVPFGFKVVDR